MSNQSFIEQIRNSKIKHPTQVGFSLKKWEKAFNKIQDKSKRDKNIYEAGKYFYDFLNKIRKAISQYNDKNIGREKLIRSYVGLINRDYVVGSEALKKQMKSNKDVKTLKSLIDRDLPVGPNEMNVNVMNVIESSLDALKYPLSEAFNFEGEKSQGRIDDLKLLDNLRVKINFASLYNIISTFWSECLWNDWFIKFDDDIEIIVPAKSDQHISRVISEHRWESLTSEMAYHTISFWKKLPESKRMMLSSEQQIIGITKQKKKKTFDLGKSDNEEDLVIGMAMAIAAEEIYWNDILEQPLPNYPDLKIRDLMKVWEILYSFGRVANNRLSTNIEVRKINTLVQYAPKFSLKELHSTLKKVTGFSKEKISIILDICSFDGDVRQDLWLKPIIPVGNNSFCALMPSLLVTNRIRLIESWMKEGGVDLDKRGYAFENHVRSDIKRAFEKSELMSDAYIHEKSMKFSDGATEEEIDFICIIGSLIVVGEIKCSLFPTEPIEIYRFFQILESASEQASRKAEFVKNNIHKLLEKINGDVPPRGLNEYKIEPIVMTNLTYGSGLELNNVPITDMRILLKYIKGEQLVFSSSSDDSNSRKKTKFYSTQNEAEENFIPFLKNPLSVRLCKNFLDRKIEPFPVFEDLGKKLAALRIFVNEDRIPQEMWKN